MKIGVVTFFSPNYGALLQGYALQKVLLSLGHEVEMINRQWGEYGKLRSMSLRQKIHFFIFPNYFEQFRRKYIRFSPLVQNDADLQDLNKRYDSIIVGSDQIWNSDCIKMMNLYYYLDWVDDNMKKYSYAVSFGKDTFDAPSEVIDKVTAMLKSYVKISVRETSGVDICRKVFNIDAVNSLDPTLLLNKKDYNRLIPFWRKNYRQYVCNYFLDKSVEKSKLISDISTILKVSVTDNYPVSRNRYKGLYSSKYRLQSVSEWLQNIRDAAYVVTDSFHGMVFSIIYRKQFVCINNKERGTARFSSLLTLLGLTERLVNIEDLSSNEIGNILINPINYRIVENKLSELQERSRAFLCSIR